MKARVLASVTLWLAAVASIAGIAWFAIDAAGRQVTSSPIAAAFPTEIPLTSSATPLASPTSRPSSTKLDGASTGTPKPTTSLPVGTRSSAAAGTALAISGAYSTVGGRLRVVCKGTGVTLDGGYAQPTSGWSVQVETAGPAEVQVLFELDDVQALLVTAACSNGHPRFDQDRIEGGDTGASPPGGNQRSDQGGGDQQSGYDGREWAPPARG